MTTTKGAYTNANQISRKGQPRTVADVKDSLERNKRKPGGVDIIMANMMLNFGNLTDEAREFVREWLK